jgi:uncharacterized protein (DUF488 family)
MNFMAGIVTVGYEGRTVDEVIAILTRLEVTELIDVRLLPLSRKAGLSKSRLCEALAAVRIEYRHLPALGNPRENRAGIRAGAVQSQREFRARLRAEAAREAMLFVAQRARQSRVALLCYERDAARCHRALIADELIRMCAEIPVVHA